MAATDRYGESRNPLFIKYSLRSCFIHKDTFYQYLPPGTDRRGYTIGRACLFTPDSAGVVTPGSRGPLATAAADGRAVAHPTGREGRPEDRLRVPGWPG